jgi:succinyl-diaminopimelate desuccinylase
LNSRFNDLWTRDTLRAEIDRRLGSAAQDPGLGARVPVRWLLSEEPASADVFLTRDERLIGIMADAIQEVTGRRPALSTGGGTSDARFIKDYCPVVEFGLVGTTMHQFDERVSLAEIEAASTIYEAFLDRYFA